MCEAGRILHHLKNNLGNPRNTVLFVGFQAEHTLGRKLVDGKDPVPIFGEPYRVRAKIDIIEGYSAHADQRELLGYVEPLLPRLRAAFVVHGELAASQSLAKGLRDLGVPRVVVPELGQKVRLSRAS
jgi:metallo-beta-lactamase family protein